MGVGGEALRKLLEPNLFSLREMPFLTLKRALNIGHFRSFVKKGWGLDPEDPPLAASCSTRKIHLICLDMGA